MALLGYSDSTAFQLGGGSAREGLEKESKNSRIQAIKYTSSSKRLKHLQPYEKYNERSRQAFF